MSEVFFMFLTQCITIRTNGWGRESKKKKIYIVDPQNKDG